MKFAVLAVGLWLAGAQGFAAQACCSEMPTSQSACDGCGNGNDQAPSPRPDCCTSLEAQKDVDLSVPRNEIPPSPVVIELLTEEGTFAWRPPSADRIAEQAASRAEGPPLYLRHEVFLI